MYLQVAPVAQSGAFLTSIPRVLGSICSIPAVIVGGPNWIVMSLMRHDFDISRAPFSASQTFIC